jgi:hypothetical protein
MKNRIFKVLIFAMSVLISCRESTKTVNPLSYADNISDTGAGILVAENIIQDIVIKNTDQNDVWAEECLKGMKQGTLVDIAFELAYSGKAVVYDFDTHEKLTTRQLKQLEKKEGFSRDKIGKIQFVESWYLHPDKVTVTKKVSSMVLGYETFDSKGEFRGYLPVFRMILN